MRVVIPRTTTRTAMRRNHSVPVVTDVVRARPSVMGNDPAPIASLNISRRIRSLGKCVKNRLKRM